MDINVFLHLGKKKKKKNKQKKKKGAPSVVKSGLQTFYRGVLSTDNEVLIF
jgi:hypothetical protein